MRPMTRETAAAIVVANPGIAVSLNGTVARVVWADPDLETGRMIADLKQNAPGRSRTEGAPNNDCQGVVMASLPEQEHRTAIINGLRALAAYLESHPDVPAGHIPVALDYSASARAADDAAARAEVDRIADLIGAVTETSIHGHYSAAKAWGPVVYRVFAVPELDRRRARAHMTYADSVRPGGEAS